MAAPPLKPRQLACANKRRYSDEFAARAAAQHVITVDSPERLWVYQCEFCRGWHLTSRKQGRRWLVTANELIQEVEQR